MAHNNHVIDGFNKDVGMLDYDTAKDHFLSLAENWEDPNPDPIITEHEGVKVLRDDLITGTKVRGGDLLISKAPSDTIVYVQPRVGLAGVSILDVAKRYDKKVVLFMPSSKKVSHHQACCIERGATPVFKRIAAMPNLNKMACDVLNNTLDEVMANVLKTESQVSDYEISINYISSNSENILDLGELNCSKIRGASQPISLGSDEKIIIDLRLCYL